MGRCFWDTITIATGCEPVSNLGRQMIGPVVRNFADELILVPFRIDLRIHALGNDICEVLLR
jgi:hypothetical protein